MIFFSLKNKPCIIFLAAELGLGITFLPDKRVSFIGSWTFTIGSFRVGRLLVGFYLCDLQFFELNEKKKNHLEEQKGEQSLCEKKQTKIFGFSLFKELTFSGTLKFAIY